MFGLGVPGVAGAQPQDDAALADPPDARPLQSNNAGSTVTSGTDPPPPRVDEAPELEPVMTTDQLRHAYADLELSTIPGSTLTVGISSIYPFQAAALSVGTDSYLLPRLRLSTLFSAGFSPTNTDKENFSVYGEASVGVAAWRWHSHTIAELPVVAARFHRENPADGPIARAVVPSSHSLELEAGALTGYYDLYRCTANCGDPDFSRRTADPAGTQLLIPYAGLRYVYYRYARSKQAPFRSASRFQLAADVLTAPFKPPDPRLFTVLYNSHPSHHPIGGRLLFRFPAIKCAVLGPCFGIDLSAGYLPTPSDFIGSLSMSVY